MPRRRRARGSGSVRQLPSGAYQATFPRRTPVSRHDGFEKAAAQSWLKKQRSAIEQGTWTPPSQEPVEARAPRFQEYSREWLAERGLKPKTVEDYRRILDQHLIPDWQPPYGRHHGG